LLRDDSNVHAFLAKLSGVGVVQTENALTLRLFL
jgi:hypothetical protein